MRALELDPHHFYEVKPEPPQFHHEMPYFADPNKPYDQGSGQQSNQMMNLRYAHHSELGDEYFNESRHRLSHREGMRSRELD